MTIRQPADPVGFPAIWGRTRWTPRWSTIPLTVTKSSGLRSIPTMSLVMNPDDLFGSRNGIYIHAGAG
jgi:hypothetical protein